MISNFKKENDLAIFFGWEPLKDNKRHNANDALWCYFKKEEEYIWCAYPNWIRCKKESNFFTQHKKYKSLQAALEGVSR